MYAFPCPHCQNVQSISPAQAGDQLTCSNCAGVFLVPKLGELKQLPRSADDVLHRDAATNPTAQTAGASALFKVFAATAAVTLLFAGFCGIRWYTTDVPVTTESHLAEVRTQYPELSTAQLIREWESITKYELELQPPFRYRTAEVQQASWFRNMAIFGGVGLAALVGAVVTGRGRRGTSTQAD